MTRYELLSFIGQGGSGTVYAAQRILPGGQKMPVAVKRIAVDPRYRSKIKELFYQEAPVALRISNHPNLVNVQDVFEREDDELFTIMELIEGCSLEELFVHHGPLPPPIIRRIAMDVCAGLAHIHGHGVVHRDISPCNVLITREGMAKISDFGLVKDVVKRPSVSSNFRGKQCYAPPEALFELKVTPVSDLSSLAAVLYEMCSGEPPLGRKLTPTQISNLRENWHIPPLPGQVPSDLRDLIMGLLRQDAEERRPDTAAKARKLLGSFEVADADEVAALVEPVYQERRMVRDEQQKRGWVPSWVRLDEPLIVIPPARPERHSGKKRSRRSTRPIEPSSNGTPRAYPRVTVRYQRRRRVIGLLAIAAVLVAVLVYRYGPGQQTSNTPIAAEPDVESSIEPTVSKIHDIDHVGPAPTITVESTPETPAPKDGVRPLRPSTSQVPSPVDRPVPSARHTQQISAPPTASTEPISAVSETHAESIDNDRSSIATTLSAGATFQWDDAPVGGPMPARIREALERKDRKARRTQNPFGWSDAPVGGPMPERIRDALERKEKERNQ